MRVTTKAPPSAQEQAERYLAKCAPAISGQDGNGVTAKLAKAVVLGFDLHPRTALSAFRAWNASCVPPWPEKDLLRLLEAAAKWPGERGNLLKKNGRDAFSPPPMSGSRGGELPEKPTERKPPTKDGFRAPTLAELHAILFHRELGGLAGLTWAADRGVLVVGQWRDWPCYGVTDASGRVLEVRRVDNEPFPEMGPLPERKSHSIKGSEKQWPVGIQEAIDYPAIALVEGVPDFLVAHDVILWEQSAGPSAFDAMSGAVCAPVAMLSASPAICADALPFFKGKRVKIFAHADPKGTGLVGGERWRRQLIDAGVASCSLWDFSAWMSADATYPKDLDEHFVERARWWPKAWPDHHKPPHDWPDAFKIFPT